MLVGLLTHESRWGELMLVEALGKPTQPDPTE
jgi:hypothetical protein